jgi:hypothetical protein
MVPLELHQHRFHTARHRILTGAHRFRHWLIQLCHFCFTGSEGRFDRFVIPSSQLIQRLSPSRRSSPRPDHNIVHVQIDQHVLHW